MPQAAPELLVIDKAHALLVWTLNHVARFPRSHRYGVGLRLEERITTILELLLRAKYTRDRLTLLQQVNLELELLRFQYRAVKDLKCLSVESYGSASRFANELGQLVGGWIKSIVGGGHEASRRPVDGTDQLRESADGGPQRRAR